MPSFASIIRIAAITIAFSTSAAAGANADRTWVSHSGTSGNRNLADHTQFANNGVGITSQNGAAVILNNSTVQVNGTGLSANTGGAIFSYGNNPINGNQPGGIGTAPILIGLH